MSGASVQRSAGAAPAAPSKPVDFHSLTCARDAVERAVEDLRMARLYLRQNHRALHAVNSAGAEVMTLLKFIKDHDIKGKGIPA